MIEIEKTITDNPFVDNMIYYAKLMALNCTVKDEREALDNETAESMKAGDTLIACVEGYANYNMFTSIPEEIIEKYVKKRSNLDVMVDNVSAFLTYLNSLGLYQKTDMLDKLAKVARIVYMDHYVVMTDYVKNLPENWLDINKSLYDICINATATYRDLYDAIPPVTRLRMFKEYLNNYDATDLETINVSLDAFQNYVDHRDDDNILVELDNINSAMRSVFISHYEMMEERKYVTKVSNNNWYDYMHFTDAYKGCTKETYGYKELYDLFPLDDLTDCLYNSIGKDDVDRYKLNEGLDILVGYFNKVSTDPTTQISNLNTMMRKMYIENYNQYLNSDIYYKCMYNQIDYIDLIPYLPKETQKMILNTQIEEISNIVIYAQNKRMLDSYLNSITLDEANKIKQDITRDMLIWYPKNYVELNNYYRPFLGLPPIKSNGEVYYDSLQYSFTESGDVVKFEDELVDLLPQGMYPEAHWRMELKDYDAYDISVFREHGVLEKFLSMVNSNTNSKRYMYLKYLGDEKLDAYKCRKALNFQLIGIPSIDNYSVKKKFLDAYDTNRDYVLRTVYSDAHQFQNDYYDKFMIIFILMNTVMDMMAGISKMLIDRDVFDARCIKYLFESMGIPYWDNIPIKYQQAMLKNLNILIKYKSSVKNVIDICNLFGFNDVKVFNYYLFKERAKDGYSGDFILEENNDIDYDIKLLYVRDDNGSYEDYNGFHFNKLLDYQGYDANKYLKTIYYKSKEGKPVSRQIINNDLKNEIYIKDNVFNQYIPLSDTDYFTKVKADTSPCYLKFIQVPEMENLTDYKNNTERIVEYDEVTAEDPTWDGGLQHELVKQRIEDYNFNAVITKYISIEGITEMSEMVFQISYFYNMLFDNLYSEELLTVEIPYLKTGHKFKLVDVICYLFAMMHYYYGVKDNIMYSPTQILYLKGYNFDECIDEILKNEKAFTQPKNPMDRENIFDINERIAEDNYNYVDEFEKDKYRIRSFNLSADIDALDEWLKIFNRSLDDFVVDDTLTEFDHVITLRDFYSLNNSYYQKNVFDPHILPTQYNNSITYAFEYLLYKKEIMLDYDTVEHVYIQEKKQYSGNGLSCYMELISPVKGYLYVMDRDKYISQGNKNHPVYIQYKKVGEDWISQEEHYIKNQYGEFVKLLTGDIYIKDKVGNIIHSADTYYTKAEAGDYDIGNIDDVVVGKTNAVVVDIDGNVIPPETLSIVIDGDVKPFMTESFLKTLYATLELNFNPNDTSDNIENIIVNDKNYTIIYNGQAIDPSRFFIMFDNGVCTTLDGSETYVPISDDKYFYTDNEGRLILNYGDWYIETDTGDKILDPDYCYIRATKAGKPVFILLRDVNAYRNTFLKPEECYILHSDGHFIPLVDSDFYRKQPDGTYKYDEEICFMIPPDKRVTQYYDPSANPRVYYMKLTDWYYETHYVFDFSVKYIKNSDGLYIPEDHLVPIDNCYCIDEDGKAFVLVYEKIFAFHNYKNAIPIPYILVEEEPNDFKRYIYGDGPMKRSLVPNKDRNYYRDKNQLVKYMKSSDNDYIIGLVDSNYDTTKSFIVILNKEVSGDVPIEEDPIYNPEKQDDVWDENDWFYTDPSYDDGTVGINGENQWYYKKPQKKEDTDDSDKRPTNPEDEYLGGESDDYKTKVSDIGSGWYLAAETYLGAYSMEPGVTYHISFDVECNFNGQVQIYCEADSSCLTANDRVYTAKADMKFHVGQTFKANEVVRPRLMFLRFDYIEYPIKPGNYFIISNMRMVKSYNDHFIPEDIPSYDKLNELYRMNKLCYDYLTKLMRETDDYFTYQLYKHLYDSLMVSKINKEAFKLKDGTYAKTYTDFLKTRDMVLYDKLDYFKLLSMDEMKKAIANEVIEVTYALDRILEVYDYGNLYMYFPGTGVSFIQQYIYQVVNFFKSWKVHLLAVDSIYRFADPNENTVKILEDRKFRPIPKYKETIYIGQHIAFNPQDATDPAGIPYKEKYPDLIDITDRYKDACVPRDRIRIISRSDNMIKYTDNYENIHLVLTNDDIKANINDDGDLIVNTDRFSVKIPNNLLYDDSQDNEESFGKVDISKITDKTMNI